MNCSFLDANVFIRYLTNDDPAKADRVEKFLDLAASGKERLLTTEMVIAEELVRECPFSTFQGGTPCHPYLLPTLKLIFLKSSLKAPMEINDLLLLGGISRWQLSSVLTT